MYNNIADVMNAINNAANVEAVIAIVVDVNTNYSNITFSESNLRSIVAQQSTSLQGNAPVLLYSGQIGGVSSNDIADDMASGGAYKIVDKTDAAKLTGNAAFITAVEKAFNGNAAAANQFLFSQNAPDGGRGLWHDISERFVNDNASGNVTTLTPWSNPMGVFVQTEIPALLDKAGVTHVNGIEITELRADFQIGGVERVHEKLAQASFVNIGYMKAADLGGGVDGHDLLMGDSRMGQMLEKIGAEANDLFSASTLNKLGLIGTTISFLVVLADAGEAIANDDLEGASNIMGQWLAETTAGDIAASIAGVAMLGLLVVVGKVVAVPVLAASTLVFGANVAGDFLFGEKILEFAKNFGIAFNDEELITVPINGVDTAIAVNDYYYNGDHAYGNDSSFEIFDNTPNLVIGDDEYIEFTGSDDHDVILANDQNNLINGKDGDDTIVAGAGDDTITGSEGEDVIEGGEGEDTLDYTGTDEWLDNDIRVDLSKGTAHIDYLLDNDDQRVYNVESVKTGGGDDTLIGADNTKVLDAGDGDDILAIGGNAPDATLYGGAGDDTLQGGNGSIVYGGPGEDTFEIGQQFLIADADENDRLTYMGKELHGGIRWANSESIWARGINNERYAINTAGELVVKGPAGKETYIANFNNTLTGPYTAGIGVGQLKLEAYRLLEAPNGLQLFETFEALMGYALKFLTGKSYFGTVDPLVLDLGGNGLDLSARSSVSPYFDIDADGFAEQVGWVLPQDGFLVRDLNGNGTIDDVSELFGNADTSGFEMLGELDEAANGGDADGMVDAGDSGFAGLRVWRDLNQNGTTEAGELQTLAEAGVESINLSHSPSVQRIAGNNVEAVGSYNLIGGGTRTIADIGLSANHRDTKWLGDTTVSAEAAALPNVVGKGTLTNLHIAMTQSADLLGAVEAALPGFDTLDLAAMRGALNPILNEWRDAIDVPQGTPGTETRADVLMQVGYSLDGGAQVYDFAYRVTDAQGTYLKLASGAQVRDAEGDVIERPSAADITAQLTEGREWTVLTGQEIQFLERYSGNEFPIGLEGSKTGSNAISQMGEILDYGWSTLNEISVRIAMQGPLAEYFEGIAYNAENDSFYATTNRQIAPMLEAIFTAATGDASADAAWLAQWNPVMDVFLQDFDRGESYLKVSYAFLFQNLVAAYENVGLDISLEQAAAMLDIPEDLIQTGAGLVTGTDDADLFYIDGSGQTLEGGAGPDSYIVGRSFGQSVINEMEDVNQASMHDILRFAQHQLSDLSFSREGNDLIITLNGHDDTLRIQNQFKEPRHAPFAPKFDPEYGVREIIFADGTVWDKLDIAQAVSVHTDGDDHLVGTDSIDFLEGGAGNDTLEGGMSGDVYSFGLGYGQDKIYDNIDYIFVDAPDVVQFRQGITFDDLTFTRQGNSDDLIISINGTGDQLTVEGQFKATHTGPFGVHWLTRVEGFYTDNGEGLVWNEVFDKIIEQAQTDGDDTIYGFAWEDTFAGGRGNDFLSGGDMADTYVFNAGDGNDVIHEQKTNILMGGGDTLRFGSGIAVADTIFTRITGTDDLLITFRNSTDSVLVKDHFDMIETGVFGVQEFNRIERFEWADGTIKTWWDTSVEAIAAARTEGDDLITGTHFDDTLDGGLGNDTLLGGNGPDIYVFNRGYGQDRVEDLLDNILAGDGDRVTFGADIAPEDILIERVGDYDAKLSIAGTMDSITIRDQFDYTVINYKPYQVEEIAFSDGTVWTANDLRLHYLEQISTDGDDLIEAFWTDDTITGGLGNDTLRGTDGSDSYVFSAGFGQDRLEESIRYVTYDDFDKVIFDGTISKEDVILTRDGDNLLVTFSNSSDSLTVVKQFYGLDYYQVEEFHFSDAVWTEANVRQKLVDQLATNGNDVIRAFEKSEVLNGGLGNDTLQGEGGGDTYVFDANFGNDVVESTVTSIAYQPDTVHFTQHNLQDVTFLKQEDDLIVQINGMSDTVTIKGHFVSHGYYAVEFFQFADGTIIEASTVTEGAISAQSTPGNDSVTGTDDDDVINGGLGNDTLEGEGGSDTYFFTQNFGQDTLEEDMHHINDVSNDTLVFQGAAYTADNVMLTRSGWDIIIGFNGTTDSVTIKNPFFYSSGSTDIENIYFSDGTYWSAQDLREQTFAHSQTAGDDSVKGFISDDVLGGGEGNDLLQAYEGNDTLEGGAGNDTLEGYDDDDSYIYRRGDGNDLIYDRYGNNDVLQLQGIAYEDLSFSRVGNNRDLLIGVDGGGSVQLEYHFHNDSHIIETINYDGGSISAAEIRDLLLTRAQTDGDDLIEGFEQQETLQGGLGNDTMQGGDEDDTYAYNKGDGHDVVYDYYDSTGHDRLVLGGGISYAELHFSRINGKRDLHIEIDGGGSVLIKDQFHGNGRLYEIEHIQFDGGSLTADQVRAMLTIPTGGNDLILGYDDTADTLRGGLGNDTLEAGEKNDTYTYQRGDGDDVIFDYYGSSDTLQLNGIALEDVSFGRASNGRDLLIEVEGGGSLLISKYFYSSSNRLETIAFDNGSLTYEQISQMAVVTDAGNDTLEGTSASDTLNGAAGNDVLSGRSGNDLLIGGLGNDALTGGIGNDVFAFTADSDSTDTITDFISGQDKIDLTDASLNAIQFADLSISNDNGTAVIGLGNGQTIRLNGINHTSLTEANFLFATPVNTVPVAVADSYGLASGGTLAVDAVAGVLANDTDAEGDVLSAILVSGVAHGALALNADGSFSYTHDGSTNYTDSFSYKVNDGTVDGNTVTVSLAIEPPAPSGQTITGTAGNDSLTGGAGNDTITGAGGGDTLRGGDGGDSMDGGAGNDQIYGEAGNDTLYGGSNYDLLDGGAGNDLLTGNADGTTMIGNTGVDTFVGGTGNDSITMDDEDHREVHGNGGWDTITASSFSDTLYGGDGSDTLYGKGGNDLLDGGLGNDKVYGEAGNDTLTGGDGYDTLDGGDGNDVITGNANNGTHLIGGAGADTLIGGNGLDNIALDDEDHRVVYGYDGWDTITGSSFADTIYGGSGLDTISGGGGDDRLYGEDYNDSINGGDGNDSIVGGSAFDTLVGGAGNDTLDGGNDHDTIAGGTGNDLMTGGSFNDIFVFVADSNSTDTITDFTSGQDKIDLTDASLNAIQFADLSISNDNGTAVIGLGNGQTIRLNGISHTSLTEANFMFATPVNTAPAAVADSYELASGGTLAVDAVAGVLANDTDAENDTLSAILVSGVAHGTLTLNANGSFSYTHDGSANYTDSLSYKVNDGTVDGNTVTVDLAIAASGPGYNFIGQTILSYAGNQSTGGTTTVTDAGKGLDVTGNLWKKVAYDYTVTANTVLTFEYRSTQEGEIQGIGFDTDDSPDNGQPTYQLYGTQAYSNFNQGYSYQGSGEWQSFTITIGQDYAGVVNYLTFINDHDGGSQNGNSQFRNIVLSEAEASNTLPVAIADSYELSSGGTLTVDAATGVLANDADAENDALSAILVSGVAHGALALNADGSFSYTHDGSANYTDSFTYKANDDTEDGNTVTVSLTIAPPVSSGQNINGTTGFDSLTGSAGDDTISGFEGADTIYGGDGNDSVDGGSDRDYLYGEGGNDTLISGSGYDYLDGGDGNDQLVGTTGQSVTMVGGAGVDTFVGGSSSDKITLGEEDFREVYGAGGADSIVGTALVDTLYGGDDNDTLFGGGSGDYLYGDLGTDRIYGEAGNDTIYAGYGYDLVDGGDGDDHIYGENTKDTLYGGSGNDLLDGGDHEDVLYGGEGNDSLEGGVGHDRLYGEAGNDTLTSSHGDDVLDGGDGDDLLTANSIYTVTFIGGAGVDTFVGGTSHDRITVEAEDYRVVEGNGGNDSIVGSILSDTLYGGDATDTLRGGDGGDSLDGGAGNDQIYGEAGNDILYGGSGYDMLDGGAGNDLLTGNANGTTMIGNTGVDTFVGGEGNDNITMDDEDHREVHGNGGWDTIHASSFSDTLYGGDGTDTLYGKGGNDLLDGGLGNDKVYGEAGNDTLTGGNGYDTLDGGDGDDMITGNAANATVLIGGTGADTLIGGEGKDNIALDDYDHREVYGYGGWDTLTGSSFSDTLYGGSGLDTIYGGAGNDLLYGEGDRDLVYGDDGDDSIVGGNAFDTLYGGAGNDTLEAGNDHDTVYGGIGNDVIEGGTLNDILYGEAGNDDLFGDDGVDTLISGAGDDYLVGGAGNDVFRFASISDSSVTDGVDYIGDFTQGTDKIDLTGLGFTDVSNFSIYNDGTYTEISDATSGFALGFNGNYTLTNADFVF